MDTIEKVGAILDESSKTSKVAVVFYTYAGDKYSFSECLDLADQFVKLFEE